FYRRLGLAVDELGTVERHCGLVIRKELVGAEKAHCASGLDDLAERRLGGDGGVDRAVMERRRMLRESEIDELDIGEFQPALAEGSVQQRCLAVAGGRERHLEPLEIGQSLEL